MYFARPRLVASALLLTSLLGVTSSARAWNADEPGKPDLSKKHNYFTATAVSYLQARGYLTDVPQSKLDTFLQYGVMFGDNVFAPRPYETPPLFSMGSTSPFTAQETITLVQVACDGHEVQLDDLNDYECRGPFADPSAPRTIDGYPMVRRWREAAWTPRQSERWRPDLSWGPISVGGVNGFSRISFDGATTARAAWQGEISLGPFGDGAGDDSALENLFHFANYRPLLLHASKSAAGGLITADVDLHIHQGAELSAMKYGAILFQLARAFWPGNPSRPGIDLLVKAGPGVPGFATGVATMGDQGVPLPTTYLGGQPYACMPSSPLPEDPAARNVWDTCATGRPSWPIFVPDTRWDGNDLPDATLPPKILGELTAPSPKQSADVALTYLGWAMHMIQDLAMPMHAANLTGSNHRLYEDLADTVPFTPSLDFQRELDAEFGPRDGFGDQRGRCAKLGLDLRDQADPGALHWEKVLAPFDEIAEQSFAEGEKVGYDFPKDWGVVNLDTPDRRALLQHAQERAVLGSMRLLACVAERGALDLRAPTAPPSCTASALCGEQIAFACTAPDPMTITRTSPPASTAPLLTSPPGSFITLTDDTITADWASYRICSANALGQACTDTTSIQVNHSACSTGAATGTGGKTGCAKSGTKTKNCYTTGDGG